MGRMSEFVDVYKADVADLPSRENCQSCVCDEVSSRVKCPFSLSQEIVPKPGEDIVRFAVPLAEKSINKRSHPMREKMNLRLTVCS